MHIPRFTSIFIFIMTVSAGLAQVSDESITLSKGEEQLIEGGEIILRELSSPGNIGRTFEVLGIMDAPLNTVLALITDYRAYPEFMPTVTHVHVVSAQDNEAILNYELAAPMGIKKRYRIRIWEEMFDNGLVKVEWEHQIWPGLKPADTIKDTQGFWLLQAVSDHRTLVCYHVYSDPGHIPFGMNWVVDYLTSNSIQEVFSASKLRAEKVHEESP